MTKTSKGKLNLPEGTGLPRPKDSVVKENLTSEYECASELLQCILDNPANRLTQNIIDMIETSMRLFKLRDEEVKELREALKDNYSVFLRVIPRLCKDSKKDMEVKESIETCLKQAKQLLNNE